MMFILAGAFGYTITAKNLPWRLIVATLVVVVILHAGKGEMRRAHWYEDSNFGSAISLTEVPGRLIEWTGAGFAAIGSDQSVQDVFARATLFELQLQVQRLAPDQVPYLKGATYALLPYMLVPRFLAPNKLMSQAGMVMLNIHFGFQTAETAAVTALGWGILPESYANFGYAGVVAAGITLGLLCGFFSRWSTDRSVTSLPTLASIAAMMTLTVIEADFAYLLTNLFQALAAVILFAVVFGTTPSTIGRRRHQVHFGREKTGQRHGVRFSETV